MFPDAEFLPARPRMQDFETIRSSANVALSVSTFCWMAAWLSDSAQVFMPLSGLFNPFQDTGADLVPIDDLRYRFYLFPINYAVPLAEHEEVHQGLRGLWRRVSPAMLRTMLQSRPRYARAIEDFLPLFDENFYLEYHPTVRQAIASGQVAGALDHYKRFGFHHRFSAFAFDRSWYARTYHQAAIEVGQGDFMSLEDHYAAIGHARGYRPCPG
jgi:hypothetical protein